MEEPGGEKEFAPSERRLEEARRKGDIAMGRDLPAAAATAGLLLAIWALPDAAGHLAGELQNIFAEAGNLAPDLAQDSQAILAPKIASALWPLLPWFVLPAVLVLLTLIAQRSFVFATDRIKPRLNRISPLAGAKKKFGPSGLVEFLRNTLKMSLICLLLVFWLSQQSSTIAQSAALPARQIILLGAAQLGGLMLCVLLMQTIIGAADLAWQHFDHRRKLRMSRREMMDELRQSEGDPHTKALRRRRAEEIATSRMISDVAQANVIVVNPEHYAVALAWTRSSTHAPICLAKGTDELAARIREAAIKANVPIRRDPPTARALYATVEVGGEIRPEHYRAVAAAIRYAESLHRKSQRTTR